MKPFLPEVVALTEENRVNLHDLIERYGKNHKAEQAIAHIVAMPNINILAVYEFHDDSNVKKAVMYAGIQSRMRQLINNIANIQRAYRINGQNIVLPQEVIDYVELTRKRQLHDIAINEDGTVEDFHMWSNIVNVNNVYSQRKAVQLFHQLNSIRNSAITAFEAGEQYDLGKDADNFAKAVSKHRNHLFTFKNPVLLNEIRQTMVNHLKHHTTVVGAQGFFTIDKQEYTNAKLVQRRVDTQNKKLAKIAQKDAASPVVNLPIGLQVSGVKPGKSSITRTQALVALRESEDFRKAWSRVKFDNMRYTGNYCAACGIEPGDKHPDTGKRAIMTGDHVKPFNLYPRLRTEPLNVQILCNHCNSMKGGELETDFRSKKQIDSLIYNNYNFKPTTDLQRDICMQHIGYKLTIEEVAVKLNCTETYVRRVIARTNYAVGKDNSLLEVLAPTLA